jgi:hypothetical protein
METRAQELIDCGLKIVCGRKDRDGFAKNI